MCSNCNGDIVIAVKVKILTHVKVDVILHTVDPDLRKYIGCFVSFGPILTKLNFTGIGNMLSTSLYLSPSITMRVLMCMLCNYITIPTTFPHLPQFCIAYH